MKGLLIEDDPSKAKKIQEWINVHFEFISLKLEGSYQTGLNAIFNSDYDFILLDMSLSNYDQTKGSFSGKPKMFGGSDILKEMRRYGKKSIVKVITQYNEFDGGLISMAELDQTLKKKYPDLYDGYIVFIAKQTAWEVSLREFINSIRK